MKDFQNRRTSIMRIAIIGSVILGVIQMIMIGAAYQRRAATNQLETERIALEENINSLIKVNQDQVDDLQAELELIQADTAELEASFPELGAHFAIFPRGLALANQSQVDLQEISWLSSDSVDTFAGQVVDKQYSIDVFGKTADCIKFIAELEDGGRDTLSMRSVYIWPEENKCSYEISLIGFSNASGN